MSIAEILGYTASALVFATFYMKTMIPLRLVAISSNIAFIAYGFAEQLNPVLILHLTLLPLNIHRLLQVRRMRQRILDAATREFDFSQLLPHMKHQRKSAGEVLFRKGDPADVMYYIAKGRISLQELDKTAETGDIVGEIGIFSPEKQRTASAVCETDCEICSLSADTIQKHYYQDPAFGFTLMRLITGRLLRNAQHEH